MKRSRLEKLTSELLFHNERCSVHIDVWYPTIDNIKGILKLGHDKIDPNNSAPDCTIYSILFDKYEPSKSPAFRVTLFCKELEGKFMYEYINQGKEVNKE